MDRNDHRYAWLDVARMLAILSIISNHALTRAFREYGTIAEAFQALPLSVSIFRATVYTFSRIGVLLFLMITGVLCLNKDYEQSAVLKRFYQKNWLCILITSEIWLFIMFWYRTLFHANDILSHGGFAYALRRCLETMLFLDQETMRSMWYIPMILCVYLLIPIFGIAVRRIRKYGIVFLLTAVFLIALVIPYLNRVLFLSGSSYELRSDFSSENLISIYLTYVLLGYLIGHGFLSKIPKWSLYLVTTLMYLLCISHQLWEYNDSLGVEFGYAFLPLVLGTVSLFELFRRSVDANKEHPVQTYISRISFGIYFLHIIIVSAIAGLSPIQKLQPVVLFFVLDICSTAGSVLMITFLSKSNILKKYLFLIK
jgi:surface polysaccharide O-acyltransferase-like enzyme